jgi:hypothetical protein
MNSDGNILDSQLKNYLIESPPKSPGRKSIDLVVNIDQPKSKAIKFHILKILQDPHQKPM